MRYRFITGPVSVQEPFLYCFGVSLGSTASRGWSSLDHLVTPSEHSPPTSTQPQELCTGWKVQGNMSQGIFLTDSIKVPIAKIRKLRLGAADNLLAPLSSYSFL